MHIISSSSTLYCTSIGRTLEKRQVTRNKVTKAYQHLHSALRSVQTLEGQPVKGPCATVMVNELDRRDRASRAMIMSQRGTRMAVNTISMARDIAK